MLKGLKVRRLSAFATLPKRSTVGAIGLDLFSAVDGIILPLQNFHCYTDIALKFPVECYGRIASRSGLAEKGIVVHAGVIDPDFTGNIVVLLYNSTFQPFYIYQGDRVAQLICEKADLVEVIEVSGIPDTPRGNACFGSTGR